ncbi:hypothetical protein BCR32DRAFT_110090 [Anaeromyces robustus]|uniref:MATH domain-containing protein n=1 Tax=Anaeromyces robustus TaxID=1754192 RepID=A0A1Y1XGL8_9FUNG|nr:hypothetical protein BCR32DRAFT_110090 [Anaeromyces robustus]|eukprot:ORX84877.1 hypothetical protein BCR32DRAFT_110090 [Anaeromyces robustus]
MDEIKSSIQNSDNNNYEEVIGEEYYEWEVENWDKIDSKILFSPAFMTAGYQWKLELFPNGNGEQGKDHISLYLYNIDVEKEEKFHHIRTKYVLFVRNYDHFNIFDTNAITHIFKENDETCGFHKFEKISELYQKNKCYNHSLMENNKIIFGVYLKVFKYNKDEYIKELKDSLKSSLNDEMIVSEDYSHWEIENWSELNNAEYSPGFIIGENEWRIKLRLNGNKENLSVFLENTTVLKNSFHVYTNFSIALRNFDDYSYSTVHRSLNYYSKINYSWGWSNFVKKEDLFKKSENTEKSLIENNRLVVTTYIRTYRYTEEQYMNELKELLDDESDSLVDEFDDEYYFEWEIEDWDKLGIREYSPEFKVGGYTWSIEIMPNGNGDLGKDNVSLYLNNIDVENKPISICTKYVLVIRHYNDYSCFHAKALSYNFRKDNSNYGYHQFINIPDLYTTNQYTNKPLIDGKRAIICVLTRTYKNNKDHYIKNLKQALQNNGRSNDEINDEGYYELKVNNFDTINGDINSPVFSIGNHSWKINLNINKEEDNISVFLRNVDVVNNFSTHINIDYVIAICNYNDYICSKEKSSYSYYNKNQTSWGLKKFMKISDLYEINKSNNKSIIENNTFVVCIYIREYKYNKEKYMKELNDMIKCDEEIVDEIYYEWEINNWSILVNDDCSPEFSLNQYKWKIKIYPFSKNNFNYVSAYFYITDIGDDDYSNIPTKFILIARNPNDYSIYGGNPLTFSFNKNSKSYGFVSFIKRNELLKKNSNDKSIIEDRKIVICLYAKIYKYNKEQYIEDLKYLVNSNISKTKENIINGNGYYEWSIDNWNILINNNEEYSPVFIIGNTRWKIKLCYNDSPNYISLYLCNEDATDKNSSHIYVNYAISISNYTDYSYNKKLTSMDYFNENNYVNGWKEFIKKDELHKKNNKKNKSIIDNNKVIISTYITEYKYTKEMYIDELKKLIKENQSTENYITGENYYEWEINNWSTLKEKNYSSEFDIDNKKWKICLGKNQSVSDEYISLSLINENVKSIIRNNNIYSKFVFAIRNVNDYSLFKAEQTTDITIFNNKDYDNGLDHLIKISELSIKNKQSNKSILENNKFTVGVYIRIYKDDIKSVVEKEEGDLVVSLYNFKGNEYNELDIRKDEYYRITDWTIKEGWVYGYSVDNKKRKGLLPKAFINVCDKNEKDKKHDLVVALYNFERINSYELSIHKNEHYKIIDWNIKNGWVYGYSCENENIKGLFPKAFIKICDNEEDSNHLDLSYDNNLNQIKNNTLSSTSNFIPS